MADPLPVLTRSPLACLGEAPLAFDYDDISLVPRHASSLPHPSDARPTVSLGAVSLEVPILASPMPDVCGPEMCEALAEAGAFGILHRFQTVEEEVEEVRSGPAAVGAAVGVTGDYRERFDALVEAGCRTICLDTANGAHHQVGVALTWARERRDDVTLIAGNVASAEAFTWLEDRGADAIRVGIAGGAVCETRTETGVFVPTPYTVAEVAQVR